MKFDPICEGWDTYCLEDGTEVRNRTILVSVKRREGQFHEDGSPVYDLNFQQIVHIEAPAHLHATVKGTVN